MKQEYFQVLNTAPLTQRNLQDHTSRHVLAVSISIMAVGNSEIYQVLLTWLMVNDSLKNFVG